MQTVKVESYPVDESKPCVYYACIHPHIKSALLNTIHLLADETDNCMGGLISVNAFDGFDAGHNFRIVPEDLQLANRLNVL